MASVIVVGKSKNREVSLADAVTVIGRDGGASIELGDLQVSRRHALLVRAAEGYFVKDLGSRNGVLVNQRRVPSRQQAKLRNGDVLSVGRTTLVFKDLLPGEGGDAESEPKVATLVRVPSTALPSVAAEVEPADGVAAAIAVAEEASDEPRVPATELTADDLETGDTEVGEVGDGVPGAETEDALDDDALEDSHDPDTDGDAPTSTEPTPAAENSPAVVRAPGAARAPAPVRPAGPAARTPTAPRGAAAAGDVRPAAAARRPSAPAAAAGAAAAPAPTAPAPGAASAPGAPTEGGRPRSPARGQRASSGRAARGGDSIPRALPAGPGAGLGGADVLLRALERAEGERVFYRNLVLVLAGLVMATFVGLLAWAIATRDGSAPAPAAPAAAGSPTPPPHDPSTTPPAHADAAAAAAGDLDAAVFARDVQPVLSARCATCHSAVGRGGGLVIAQSDDARTVEANLWAVRRFVRPGRPQESALLLKPLPAHEGGPGHGGGEVLTMDAPEWRAMAAWVEGTAAPAASTTKAAPAETATPTENRAPTPRIQLGADAVRVGEPLALLGAADDLDGDPLSFRWALKARPAGSSAAIDRPGEPAASLLPDRAGTYVVMLVVHDGRSSGTTELTVVAEELAGAAGAAGAASAPGQGPVGARAFQALTGAAPAADVAAALANLSGDALVEALLKRPEVHQAWWDAELEHFALTGEHRPKGVTWDSVPDRLRTGRLTPVDALQAVLFSQGWTARHAGRDAYVSAVLERVLGLRADEAALVRPAAERLYDGHPAELFGKQGESQADLVRIAAQDARARRALLARAHRRVTGSDAPGDVLDAALAEVVEAPARVLPIVVRWACSPR